MSVTIVPGDRPDPPIAKAVIVGDLLIVTVVPDDDSGAITAEPALAQSRRVFSNLARVLDECGSSLHEVAHVTVYLPDLADRAAMTEAWLDAFPDTFPGRATIGVAALAHPDMKIEITALAGRGMPHR